MASVRSRPPAFGTEYDDVPTYGRAVKDWNPERREVIVIDDSPSPGRTDYNEPPASNTRNAVNKRRRLPTNAQLAAHNVAFLQTIQDPVSMPLVPTRVNPLGTFDTDAAYGVYGDSFPATSAQHTGLATGRYAWHPNDRFRSSYGSPYNPQFPAQVAPRSKRKRDDCDTYSDRTLYSRHTALSSTSSRQSRIHQKNREVVLRKERDVLPNFTGRPYDDHEGHYIIVPNSELTQRYVIDKLLGQGTFGKVVRAYDRQKCIWVAIKIIRAVQKYRDASMIELRVLRTLQENDPSNRNNCIHLRDCFDYRNHVCIVTELLNQSIFDFLKANNFAPFPSEHIRHFATQLLTSVAFLHDLDLIHTDLKPENILLVSNSSELEPYNGRSECRNRRILSNSELRLIDFGSATFSDEYHSNVVSTRHYRAPEIILGMGWSFPCDIWSIGCILVEFCTGDALFQTHDNLEHLAMMEIVCGRIDGRIIRSCSKIAQKMFRPSGRLDYPNKETSKDSRKFVKQMKSLGEMFPPTNTFNNHFCDLLQRIFKYDPEDRITASEALQHPFFSRHYSG